jgi:hypothetical protein
MANCPYNEKNDDEIKKLFNEHFILKPDLECERVFNRYKQKLTDAFQNGQTEVNIREDVRKSKLDMIALQCGLNRLKQSDHITGKMTLYNRFVLYFIMCSVL